MIQEKKKESGRLRKIETLSADLYVNNPIIYDAYINIFYNKSMNEIIPHCKYLKTDSLMKFMHTNQVC